MKAILSISLLLAAFSPGVPMNCYQCMGVDCATPGIQECADDEEACISSVMETTLVSSLLPNYNLSAKSCSQAALCMQNYVSISTSNGGNFRSNAQCCYTDLCNDTPVSLPEPEDPSPNGVVCPSCFVINSTECPEMESIDCSGGETKCFKVTADISIDFLGDKASLYLQGCGTPNACFFPLVKPPNTTKLKFTITERRCIDALSGETGASQSLSSLESTIPGQEEGSWTPGD